METTPKIASFIAETGYSHIPNEVVRIAKNAVLDCLGVTIAGSKEPVAAIMAEHVKEMKAVEVFFRRKSHVVHVGCHAFAEDEERDSYFKVARAFPLRLGYLMDKCTLKGEPLVLLNACNTGVNPRSTADFVRVFLGRLGACGVIATEYDVPETFAVEFARKFYEGFLAGETVGEALLSARRYFLEKRHSPLGLLYSAYVELETCIEMKESDDGSDDGSGDGKE